MENWFHSMKKDCSRRYHLLSTDFWGEWPQCFYELACYLLILFEDEDGISLSSSFHF